MKKITSLFLCLNVIGFASMAQLQSPSLKKDAVIKKNILQSNPVLTAPAGTTTASVYTLTSAKINIRTGADNKENGASMIFFFREKDGIWGKGADLFEGGTKAELKVNSNFELILNKIPGTQATAFTLDNLQARGLYFAVYYSPTFFADAWKIESLTVTLEFKDQFGNLHSSFGNRLVQYNVSSGLLTNSNWLLKATADGAFFTPSAATVASAF